MNIVQVEDDGGDTATVMEYNGQLLPKSELSAIRDIADVTVHPEDIIVVAYPKSGTHWMMEITHLLLANSLSPTELIKMQTMLESTPEVEYKELKPPRILNTHLFLHQLPTDVVKKKARIVYILRNPRDLAVSYYNFMRLLPFCKYSGKWENFYRPFYFGKFFYGSWFDHTLHWLGIPQTHPDLPIFTLFYEDIKEHPLREVKKLCAFLSLKRDEDFLRKVCEKCAFESMKKNKAGTEVGSYFRKGQVGDWKNWFTVAQNEWFDYFYQKKMKNCPIGFRYSID